MKKKICMRCGKEYEGTPTVSKENVFIMICPECAKEERKNESV